MEKNRSNNVAVCIICGILTAFGIVASILSLANGSNSVLIIKNVIDLVISILIAYYAIFGYKKPNGNLLRYIILIFAANVLCGLYLMVQYESSWRAVCCSIVIGLLCYIAGRLHKVKQNIILMSIAAVFILIIIVIGFANKNATIEIVAPLIIWIDICVAYVLRYKEHKEAGLMDKVIE